MAREANSRDRQGCGVSNAERKSWRWQKRTVDGVQAHHGARRDQRAITTRIKWRGAFAIQPQLSQFAPHIQQRIGKRRRDIGNQAEAHRARHGRNERTIYASRVRSVAYSSGSNSDNQREVVAFMVRFTEVAAKSELLYP